MSGAAVWCVVMLCIVGSVQARHDGIARSPYVSFVCKTATSTEQRCRKSKTALNGFFDRREKKDESSDFKTSSSGSGSREDDNDPVERMFSFFFGKKEEAPMGLARFGAARFPEQYPATKHEWAASLDSDDEDMAIVRPFLKNTNLECRPLTLGYDANRDGWNALTFHNSCDRRGAAVVLCTTCTGKLCGGYNPKGWVGYGEARGSIAAFLFVVTNNNNNNAAVPGIKLRKVGGPSMAQMDYPENGPCFGADSLVIPLNDNDDPTLARSKLGSYYERFDDGTNSLFPEGGMRQTTRLKELKIYHGVYAKDEYIPFTDAEPFALY